MNHFMSSNSVHRNGFQTMIDGLEEEDSLEEINIGNGKKRRLSADQVHALEKIFEDDNKLDPERKTKVAHELGLQPRQVAIWFQNRRARWKTKQLEREYNLLKTNYEALKLNLSKIEQEKEGLVAELKGLKQRIGKEKTESLDSAEKGSFFSPDLNIVLKNHNNYEVQECINFPETKALSDSDSSGILQEKNNMNPLPTMDGIVMEPCGFSLYSSQLFHPPPAVMSPYEQQFMKLEEQNPFCIAGESHNGFSVDHPPFSWYFSDKRHYS